MSHPTPPRRAAVTLLVAALALAGCEAVPPAVPIARPISAATPPPETAASAAERLYYAQVQRLLLEQGLLRTETDPADAPFDDRTLAQNFLRIAFREEFDRALGGVQRQEAPTKLTRWQEPLRVSLRFGGSVSATKSATDTARIASFLAKLSRLTGMPIRLVDSAPNFYITIASVDERRQLGPSMAQILPELTQAQIDSVVNMDHSTYCVIWSTIDATRNAYQRAYVVIPAEHPDLLRLSCIHEEITQALGLPNDSNAARPSIFNDNEEFALLTRQDELMLRMLYNPALRPGMTEAEARAIVITLASALLGGES